MQKLIYKLQDWFRKNFDRTNRTNRKISTTTVSACYCLHPSHCPLGKYNLENRCTAEELRVEIKEMRSNLQQIVEKYKN